MFRLNQLSAFGQPLEPADAASLGVQAVREVQEQLKLCPAHRPTVLHALPSMAAHLHLGSLHIKDESTRLGLGSFRTLAGGNSSDSHHE